ncbi:MAG TPA: metal-sensing transcriptional repressor, partial [Jiangellaceae bacterium]
MAEPKMTRATASRGKADDQRSAVVATGHAAGCGCAVHDADGRKAVGVDPDAKTRNLKRLRRIEGQVRGLQKMVD